MLSMASKTNTPSSKPDFDYAELSIACVGGLALALIALFLCVVPLTGKVASGRDFVVYWATGQQLAHNANPYDGDALMQVERSAGLSSEYGALYMRNPPWDLILTLPLGFIGLRIGALLWSLLLAGCLAASVRILWTIHGRPPNRLHWLGYSFAPAMICLFAGQTSLFALLGLVLFLRLHATRPFLAGVCLWLCALKPHLFLPFGVVLLAWIVASKRYKILAGATAAMAASCALVYLIDPMAWAQYFQMIRVSGIQKEYIPCLSVALRVWLNPDAMWIPYVPSALGCIWALGYFWARRHVWDWLKHGSPLMLASILLAPYCWMFDQSLAVPALLHGAYVTQSRVLLAVLAFSSVLIDAEVVGGVKMGSMFFLWTAPAWLLWYLFAGWNRRGSLASEPSDE
jgi:Glycosyltransferase family 87